MAGFSSVDKLSWSMSYPVYEMPVDELSPQPPGANVIKLFTAVIYCHSMVIPSFCVIKLYYLGNYHGMAVNYQGIK